jgi:short-chain Z-isoprenyl diphosphate synthase
MAQRRSILPLPIRRGIKSLLYPLYERRLVRYLDYSQTPHHVGIILDGNRRWAKANPDETGSTSAARGHRAGAEKIIEFLGWCEEAQVRIVTIWLLSTDNFKRSEEELHALLTIIGETVDGLKATGRWNIKSVGSLELLPEWLQEKLRPMKTANVAAMEVNVAIGYGGRTEIVDAVKCYLNRAAAEGESVKEAAEKLSAGEIANFLYTAGQPDPELVIRTSGEQRLGGFLLWQSAHSEFYFCEAYWPDFRRLDFLRALRSYATRHRRFGA